MPLLDIWEKARDSVISMSALQILTIAGNGALKDNSNSSYELREFLSYVSIDALEKYAGECLNEKFPDSGFFLQDIVNELGRRLEHSVEPGLYRGVKGKIGFDGLWSSPENHCLLVEVKSSTTYTIDLDRIASYRSSLLDNGKIDKGSSVLIVVGSEDTSGLEAQIRGSRYAWDMRIISLEGLIKLVKIKDSTEEEITGRKIRSLLIPIEYTKLDGIIDVMFTTTTDIEETINTQGITVEDSFTEQKENDSGLLRVSRTGRDEIELVKQKIIQLLERKFNTPFQAKSRALYFNKDGKLRAFCAVSKKYDSNYTEYWYAYRLSHRNFLNDTAKAYIALGCVDCSYVFLLPSQAIEDILDRLSYTESKTGNKYWHLFIGKEKDGDYVIVTQKGNANFKITNYITPF